jgi:hypothetical protein
MESVSISFMKLVLFLNLRVRLEKAKLEHHKSIPESQRNSSAITYVCSRLDIAIKYQLTPFSNLTFRGGHKPLKLELNVTFESC